MGYVERVGCEKGRVTGGGRGSGFCGACIGYCDEYVFVSIITFTGFFTWKEGLFGGSNSVGHDRAPESSDQVIVFNDKEQHLRHATGIDD